MIENERAAALTELVAVKDLKDEFDRLDARNYRGNISSPLTDAEIERWRVVRDQYLSRKPKAWAAARAALTPLAPPEQDAQLSRRELIDYLAIRRQELGGSVSEHNHRRLLETQTTAELRATHRRIAENEARAAPLAPLEPPIQVSVWLVVKEHAIEFEDGGRPALGYLLPAEFPVFASDGDAMAFLKGTPKMPLGWVVKEFRTLAVGPAP